MNDVLKTLLESDALDDNLKGQLKEAWENKLKEAREEVREEVENEVRADLTRRYESDRAKMVEAMDKFMTEAIKKELVEFEEDRKQVFATRARLARQIRENKEKHNSAVQKSVKALEAFTLQKINQELKEFLIDKKELVEAKKANERKLAEIKEGIKKVAAERVNKLEQFVIKKISEEITEFAIDKKELVEQKVRMAREAKQKLDETRKNFVERSAALVEKTLRESLVKEFTQFRKDIKEARHNHFGRKIFEAFAAEYMTSYLSEGSEVKKLMKKLDESKSQTETAIKNLNEQKDIIDRLHRKVKISEDKSIRDKTMSELLSPLNKDNRKIMEEILVNVKTERLREAFKKHLPSVLNEGRRDAGVKATLTESETPKRASVAMYGNKKNVNNIAQATDTAKTDDDDVIRLQALAGIKR